MNTARTFYNYETYTTYIVIFNNHISYLIKIFKRVKIRMDLLDNHFYGEILHFHIH